MVIGVFAVLFTVSAAFLYMDSCSLKKYMAAKNEEMEVKISEEREAIKKDFQERYKSAMESYEAMYKELASENKKVRNMEKSAIEKNGKD
jgi:predicted Holliday junction resolvase-like endonuclease